MTRKPQSEPEDGFPTEGVEDEDGSNSMFDHFLVLGSFGALISVDALLILVGDWLFGPLQPLLIVALGIGLIFLLVPVWSRTFRWLEKVMTIAYPDRAELIRTPTLLQNGYERLQSSWLGLLLMLVVIPGLPLLAITRIRDFFALFEQPLWGLVCVGLFFPFAIMIAESAIALIAGFIYGGPDKHTRSEDTRRMTDD